MGVCRAYLPVRCSTAAAGAERWGRGQGEIWTPLEIHGLRVSLLIKLHNCRLAGSIGILLLTVLGSLQLVRVKIPSAKNFLARCYSRTLLRFN